MLVYSVSYLERLELFGACSVLVISEHLLCTSGQFVTKSVWSFFVTDNMVFFVTNRDYVRELFAVGAN